MTEIGLEGKKHIYTIIGTLAREKYPFHTCQNKTTAIIVHTHGWSIAQVWHKAGD